MIESMFLSALLRTLQNAVEASTTLLCGLLVAGVMRRMMGAEGVRRLFGGPGWKGLLRAWAVGTVLPVCSLGVIPIAREMRRAGVRSGTVLAFVLAAPHINPLSLLYGLTLSEPIVVICFAIGSLVVALAAGASWDWVFAKDGDAPPSGDETMPAPGLKRLAAVFVSAGRESMSPSMGYVLLGLLATGLIAGLLPHGCLGMTMRHDDWTSPALMAAIALPLYVGPLQGMMRLGLMFEHGNSVGAAFALFELGIGVNVGLIAWLMVLFRWKRILAWLALITGVTLALGYAAEGPLYFAHEVASHTHAFDEWTSPFVGSAASWQLVSDKVAQKIGILEIPSLAGLALLILVGVLTRLFDSRGQLENWLTKPPAFGDGPVPPWNRGVPGPVLGLVTLGGLIAFSIVALYVYYPAPEQVFTEMKDAKVGATYAVKLRNKEEAIRQIEHWDLLTRKLQVGVFIRTGHLDSEKAKLAEDLRESLEDLRDLLLANQTSEAIGKLPAIAAAYAQCRDAFLKSGTTITQLVE